MADFMKDLDIIIQTKYRKKILKIIKDSSVKNTLLNLNNSNMEKLLHKYKLNNIEIKLNIDKDCGLECKYYYKDIEINPDGYWIQPENYRKPTVLEILLECIYKDRYNPDIKHLESR